MIASMPPKLRSLAKPGQACPVAASDRLRAETVALRACLTAGAKAGNLQMVTRHGAPDPATGRFALRFCRRRKDLLLITWLVTAGQAVNAPELDLHVDGASLARPGESFLSRARRPVIEGRESDLIRSILKPIHAVLSA